MIFGKSMKTKILKEIINKSFRKINLFNRFEVSNKVEHHNQRNNKIHDWALSNNYQLNDNQISDRIDGQWQLYLIEMVTYSNIDFVEKHQLCCI
jgi:hypothetical protein